jgi:hypothetical protein
MLRSRERSSTLAGTSFSPLRTPTAVRGRPRLVRESRSGIRLVSWPEARHSRNIESRSAVSFVIFETPVPVEGRTRAVYAEATAAEVSEADREHCLSVFDRRSRADGLGTWTPERVIAPGNLRLYHAVVSQLFVLEPDRDIRREVELDLSAARDRNDGSVS